MIREKISIYIAIILAMLFWSISYIWTKIALTVLNPVTIIFLRLTIASAVLWIIGWLTRRIQPPRQADMKSLLLLALFQPFLYFLGENFALSYVSATVAAVIVATIPLFTPVAAFFFFKERLRLQNFIGICLSVAGVILVVYKKDFSWSASIPGILLLFLAVAAAIAFSVAVLRLSGRYNAFSLITYQNTIGVVYFLPLFVWFDLDQLVTADIPARVWLALILLAVFSSSAAFMLFIYVVRRIGINRANTFSNVIPVFTAGFALMFLNERLTIINILGIGIVIAGLVLSQKKPSHPVRIYG